MDKNNINVKIARIEEHIDVINREMGAVQKTTEVLVSSNNEAHERIYSKLNELTENLIKITAQQKYLIALVGIISGIIGGVIGYLIK